MSKIWFTADWHFGEPRMVIMQRPHRDAQHDFEVIRDNHNSMVQPEDLVIVVGDAVCKRSDNPNLWLPKVSQLNGHKWLIMGNHDEYFAIEHLREHFEKVIPNGDGIELDIKPPYDKSSIKTANESVDSSDESILRLYATHYPTQSVAARFNIVGHIHMAWKYQKNMLNVGVDVNHFRPYNADEIPFYIKAVTEFYDDDVWVANHPANKIYDSTRGKPGRYFDQKSKD